MTIGIDVGALAISDDRLKVGVWRVTYHLLKELSLLDIKNIYKLYTFKAIDPVVLNDFGPRMQQVVVKPAKGWMKVSLPAELILHPVDTFVGLSQSLPIFSRVTKKRGTRMIGFIYDLGFIHHPDAYPGSYKVLVKQTDEVAQKSDHVVTISHAAKHDICKKYPHLSDKITVAYPGVEDRFGPDGSTFAHHRPYFLFVGSLKKGKNITTAIRAFAHFLKTSKKVYDFLLVGGDYWYDTDITKLIDELDVWDYVRRIGYVEDEQLPAYYRGAVAFVSPSLWEGFCLPAVEAMACGTPVIGATTGAFAEVTSSASILVNPGDINAIIAAMKELTDDPEKRQRLVTSGLQQSKQFTWQSFAKTIHQVLTAPRGVV